MIQDTLQSDRNKEMLNVCMADHRVTLAWGTVVRLGNNKTTRYQVRYLVVLWEGAITTTSNNNNINLRRPVIPSSTSITGSNGSRGGRGGGSSGGNGQEFGKNPIHLQLLVT